VKITAALKDEAHEYMQRWVKEDEWCDLAVMLMEGATDLAAHHLVQCGAINSKNCYEDARDIEFAIEVLACRIKGLSKGKQNKRYDAVFEGCLVVSCNDCNHVSFVHSGNEKLYPEVEKQCWSCDSTNIETKRWEKG
jgi:hypothetical protein